MLLWGVQGRAAGPDAPGDGVAWYLVASPWTHHYRYSPEYKPVWALGMERETSDHALYGLALFSNSYGQPSAYAYYGHVFNNVTSWSESLYVKMTVGVIYGYVHPYEDKMLLNYHGFSPAIIPSLGWHLDHDWSVQANFLGTAAVMFTLGRQL
jgi:hypothetical protein